MPHGHIHQKAHERRDFLEDIADIVDGLPQAQLTESATQLQRAETFFRTVYQTLPPDFSGAIGGYSTQGQDDPTPTQASGDNGDAPAAQVTGEITSPGDDSGLGSTLAVAPATSSSAKGSHPSTSFNLPSPTASSVLTAPSSTPKDSAESGPSAGAKAGIAFGIIGAVMLISVIVLLIFNRRKRQMRRQTLAGDNEKLNSGMGAMAGGADSLARMPSRSDPKAPRISLRPVTQFLPNWNVDKNSMQQRGAGAHINPAAANTWDRPGTSQSNHPNNPFGSGAERIDTANGPDQGFGQNAHAQDPWTANGPAIGAAAAAGAAAGAAAAPLTRKASMRKESQRDVDLTVPGTLEAVPPSPAGTEFSASFMPAGAPHPQSSGAAAIAAAGGPATSTVHRVQLDFNPTLEDEMGLRAGDLVRLLHEYDDGWALCIRLDRSQQGVVPRTCLSSRPVKPRPPQGPGRPGPPINPQGGYPRGPPGPPGRPMTPQGRPMTPQGRPMTPQGQRPPQGMGPRNGPPGPPGGRPMSPGPRSQSPGPRYQGPPGGRPQSPNGMNPRPNGPPGPSPMNPAQSPNQAPPRKPVPGQAY